MSIYAQINFPIDVLIKDKEDYLYRDLKLIISTYQELIRSVDSNDLQVHIKQKVKEGVLFVIKR